MPIVNTDPKPVVLKKPKIVITNPLLTSAGEPMTKFGDIYLTQLSAPFELAATTNDENSVLSSMNLALGKPAEEPNNFVVMIEKIVKQESGDITVVDDVRYLAVLTSTNLTLSSDLGFATSGNWRVTADRLNKGLEEINAPFRIEMETLEFDVLNG